MIYVSQIIMLYTLDIFRAVCQLYLNKSGESGVGGAVNRMKLIVCFQIRG